MRLSASPLPSRSGYRRVIRTSRQTRNLEPGPGQPRRQVGQVEVGGGHPVVVLEQASVGLLEPGGQRRRVRRRRTSGSRTRPARPPPGRRRWRAAGDASPTRPRGCRSPPTTRAARRRRTRRRRRRWCIRPPGGPSSTGHAGAGDQAFELGAVPVLGRARAASRSRRRASASASAPPMFLRASARVGCSSRRVVLVHTERVTGARRCPRRAGRDRTRCGPSSRRCPGPPARRG